MSQGLFTPQLREAMGLNMGIVTMPTFGPSRMTPTEANSVDWKTFSHRMDPLFQLDGKNGINYILTSKTVGWSIKDANLFAGHEEREIDEISDLSDDEAKEFLCLNARVARQLLQEAGVNDVVVSIGFNPEDFSTGHHSIRRLHSHIRVTPSSEDLARRTSYSWPELERFDQLAFIEPFSPIYHDFIQHQVDQGLFIGHLAGTPEARLGYSSLFLKREGVEEAFTDVAKLYRRLRAEYKTISSIFTDGSKDPSTDRYNPRKKNERAELLEQFTGLRQGIYSERSWEILHHLATHLKIAQPRPENNPRDMSNAGKIYISRGFAGALNFHFSKDNETVRFDFLPRVVTTSGVTKTIMGESLPSIIAKTSSPATEAEQAGAATFLTLLHNILQNSVTIQPGPERKDDGQ